MNPRRSARWIAPLLLLLLLITACSRPASIPPAPAAQPASGLKALRVGVVKGMNTEAIVEALIAGYQDSHADVRIEKVPVSFQDSRTALPALMKEGRVDVVPLDTWAQGDERLYVDLDPYILKTGFDPGVLDSLPDSRSVGGKPYGLPYGATPYVLACNSRLFEQVGVALPTNGLTWEQFRDTAKQVLAVKPDQAKAAVSPGAPEHLVRLYLEEQTGGRMWEATDEQIAEALRFFATMTFTDKTLAPAAPLDWKRIWTGPGHNYLADPAPMVIAGLGGVISGKAVGDEWEYVPTPTLPGRRRATYAYIAWMGIAGTTDRPDLAFDFLAYAASPDGAAAVARAGLVPARITDDVARAWRDQGATGAAGALIDTLWVDSPGVGARGGVTALIMQAANQVLSGTKTVDEAMAAFVKEAGPTRQQLK